MKNADKNSKDGTWSGKERWAFSFAQTGMIDIPAYIDVALTVTGKSKVTMFGYSMGTVASLYGLADQQDYYARRVDRVILLAACVFPTPWTTYEDSVK